MTIFTVAFPALDATPHSQQEVDEPNLVEFSKRDKDINGIVNGFVVCNYFIFFFYL
jgi:hypothetical protein